MGFFSSLLKTPLDICNEELLDLEKTTHIYITNHYDDKRIKAFVKAYNSLTESQINSRLKLMSAYMRDLSRSKRYMIAFSYHNSKEDVIKDYQDFAAYMTAKTVYDKDDLICADTACKLHYLYKKAVSVELAVFLSLKITDLFPKTLLDELLDNYAAHKEYALIQELTLDLLSKYKDTDGKYSYWLASALMVLHPELLKDAKDFAIRAGKKGYSGSDDLLKKISAELGEKEEIDNAKVEKNLEEMRERMKRAESNRNLYIALCCDGTHVYSDEREKEIAREEYSRKREAYRNTLKDDKLWDSFEDYVFLGDSRVVGYDVFGYLPSERVLAEAGDTINSISDNMDTIRELSPKYIFISYGINDIGIGYWPTKEEYAAAFADKLHDLQKAVPDAQIYVNSIIPAREDAAQTYTIWQGIPDYSEAVRQMCEEEGIPFIDNSSILEEHPDLYAADGVHMQSEFYQYWGENQLLGVYDYENGHLTF